MSSRFPHRTGLRSQRPIFLLRKEPTTAVLSGSVLDVEVHCNSHPPTITRFIHVCPSAVQKNACFFLSRQMHSLADLGSIFFFHGALSAAALAMGLFEYFVTHRMRPSAGTTEPEPDPKELDAVRSTTWRNENASQTLLYQFMLADTNGDGSLDPSELGCLVSSLGYVMTPEEVHNAHKTISRLNVDGHDRVTFADFVRWFKREGRSSHFGVAFMHEFHCICTYSYACSCLSAAILRHRASNRGISPNYYRGATVKKSCCIE
jgi:hypothetical protein